MRPTNTNTTAAAAGLQRWNSPLPYLFGGLAVVLGLISLALVLLACSFRKSSSDASSRDHEAQEKPAKPVDALQPEMEPRIVVIMAGDDNPTYLAKPISSPGCTAQQA